MHLWQRRRRQRAAGCSAAPKMDTWVENLFLNKQTLVSVAQCSELNISEKSQILAMAEPMPGCKLFVGNITERVQKHQLRSRFGEFLLVCLFVCLVGCLLIKPDRTNAKISAQVRLWEIWPGEWGFHWTRLWIHHFWQTRVKQRILNTINWLNWILVWRYDNITL